MPDRSAAPAAPPAADDRCTAQMKKQEGCVPPARQAGGGGTTDDGLSPGAVAGIAVAVLAVAALPLLPLLWRGRVRARRLAATAPRRRGRAGRAPEGPAPGTGDDPAPVAERDAVVAERTLAAWRELTDSAWDYGIAPDEARSPRSAAERIVRLGGLEGAAAESAGRVATAVEQVLYAPRPRPADGLAGDVGRVLAGLRAHAGRGARLRASLAPRSAARVLWELARRRSAAAERLRTGRPAALWRRAGAALRPARPRG
ncbi:transglutaminase [Streptomyces albireticuli]|uniref:Transglutaminase n=1 Tax=Streptomyces albireticuli TaxID=1940 RepID=A0A1Z2L8D8_9ACTN|nr:transglutaminase [Streptomyces albireticuli]